MNKGVIIAALIGLAAIIFLMQPSKDKPVPAKTVKAPAAVEKAPAKPAKPFQEVFNENRAMFGKGHTFTWNGAEHTTDHPEELEAAADATQANAEALLASATAKNKEVAELGFEWKLTGGILKSSQEALSAGDFQKAMNLAAQAKYHARIGIAQYHYSQKNWHLSVPQ